ncbi:MAG TPA: CHAT domain-containing protein [Longimicrobium sp.]|nr:CHAT domain-containing protein [Longimicrobium sp.]
MKRGVILALTAAVLAGTAVIGYALHARPSPMRQLARMNPARPFAPRLSIATEYHGCEPAPAQAGDLLPRMECGKSDAGSLDLPGLAGAGGSTDPDLLRASGLAAIIWPDPKDDQALSDAIVRLEKALRLSRRRVPLLIDLSAAHMVRAEREQQPSDLLVAMEYADEAVALEPRNLAARYNAALARQAFALDEEAERAWDAYLSLDSSSEWAKEARARKDSLITTPREIHKPDPNTSTAEVDLFAARYPQEAREYGWDHVLGEWGAALEKGDTAEASLQLGLAQELGRALKKRPGGDASLADAVDAIRAAQHDRAATLVLARAHQAYAAGQPYIPRLQGKEALPHFDSVARMRPASPVLLQWNTLLHATAQIQTGEVEEPKSDLHTLLAEVDSARYPALMGRARRMLGAMLLQRRNAAREQFASSARHSARAGEAENEGDVLSMDGEAAHEEGDTVAAYQILYRAQRALRPYRKSRRLHTQLIALARYTADDGMPHAALAILNEDVRVARREGTPARLLDGFQRRSRVNAIIGDAFGAARDWDSAAAIRLPEDEAQQNWARAALQLASPDSVSGAELNAALRALSGNELWLTTAFGRAADVRIAERDLDGASRDLEAIVTRVVKSPGPLGGALLEQRRESFDRLVMLYLRMGKPIAALQTLERGRLSFARQRDSAAVAGDSWVATRDTLRAPPGHVALEYTLIGDTLIIWVLRGDTLHVKQQTVDRQAFVLAVEQVGAALESPDAPVPTRALRRLYDQLIRPVRGYLGPAETPLVILADGEVAGVPFAALLDGNRYLIEDHPLRFAATLADAAYQAPPRALAGPALLVADPAFDKGAYPLLLPLDWARMEVDSLLRIYPRNVLLRGDSATRDTFVASAQSASVIHYAGHAVFVDARPERSYLVLAGADTTGRLTAEAVRGLRLGGVRLVVLSACRTLRSREGRSGGFAGLSGALLAAEAGGVVGSLWQVSDELTGPLMSEFHDQFKESGDPARALRDAQLAMLRSKDDPRLNSPAAWAGFRYTGSQRP